MDRCPISLKFPFHSKVRKSHTGIDSSMDQERTFIHHKTGQPTTMKTVETCFQKTGENGQKVETLFHLSQEYQVRKFAQETTKKCAKMRKFAQ